ncbi:MAG: hypothetical protein PHF82_08600 [Lutispora sp.]|nr:hypothetical protein [Lutispora sp.]
MSKFKKLLSLVLVVIMLCAMSTSVFASDSNYSDAVSVEKVEEIYNGVSPQEPTDIQTRSTSIPTDVWDITEDGRYDFAGTSYYQNLYTNYKFTGKDSYTVEVTNNGDNNLTVKVKTRLKTYSTKTIAPGTTSNYSVTGMKSSTEFYILFQGSDQDFSGYIE